MYITCIAGLGSGERDLDHVPRGVPRHGHGAALPPAQDPAQVQRAEGRDEYFAKMREKIGRIVLFCCKIFTTD